MTAAPVPILGDHHTERADSRGVGSALGYIAAE
jgi:hypothetical protein